MLSEKNVIPHFIADDIAEKTQWNLNIYWLKVSNWKFLDII